MKLDKVIVFENSKTCSYCKRLDPILAGDAFEAFLSDSGAELVKADAGTDPSVYGALKRKYGFSGEYPRVYAVNDAGKVLGNFLARNFTAAKLIAALEKLCPGCTDDGEDAPADDACADECPKCGFEFKFCPNCGAEACAD